MPKSKPHGKWLISLWSSKVNPIHQRVLDIGDGAGAYSDLVGPILPDAEERLGVEVLLRRRSQKNSMNTYDKRRLVSTWI